MDAASSNDRAREAESFARSTTARLLATDHSAAQALKLMAELFAYADAHVGSLPECCGAKDLVVSEPELAAVRIHIRDNLSKEEQLHILENLLGPAEPGKCPFIIDGKCAIYEARPLICRSGDGESHNIVGAMIRGFNLALADIGVKPRPVDLLSEIQKWLEARVRSGELGAGKSSEPSGFLGNSPEIVNYYRTRRDLGNFAEALKFLKTGTTAEILRFGVPRAYRSEDEIDEWFAYAKGVLDHLEEASIDPGEAFNTLVLPITFEFPYAGRDAKPILSQFGSIFLNKIIRPLFPDLCEPIEKRPDGRIRVGYISTAMCDHHGSNWALGWMRGHPEDFETYAIHLGKKVDHVTGLWKSASDYYHHLMGPLAQEARFIKSLNLDALIYTDIASDGRTNQAASMRLAPMQCNAWGHAITSGLPNQDYYLSSDLMEPPDGDDHYTERLVRLPNSGLVFEPFDIPPAGNIREELGLPKGFLPFMNQNVMKAVPRWDRLFKEINDATGAPIVFLALRRYETELTAERLNRAGIKAIWLPRLPHDKFLRLMQSADVILDTVEWSGGNTTVQALAMGRPVVTLPGQFMRGRHSLAFHRIAGADNLIASSPEEYVAIASDPNRLTEGTANARPENLFNDPAPCIGLNEFLRSVCRP